MITPMEPELAYNDQLVMRQKASRRLPVIAGRFNVLLLAAAAAAAALAVQPAGALRFTSIQMPALVQRGASFWLACQFELAPNGQEQLYSVKWYKNNEEFYRLLMGSPTPPPLTSASGGTPAGSLEWAGDKFQQQHFPLAGVNVLMSASNATHVRLLNASLDSEGAFACEISSENLSTIRHEKEIKVYVLPHLKMSVIGLRSLYAMGERVELECATDLSRPVGALAWFINGQRITTTWRFFELEWKRAREAQLERASLRLKFKLTEEILAQLAANANQSQLAGQWRDQSSELFAAAAGGELRASQAGARPPPPPPPLELLKLECRFKLADVSDVTFNELKVGLARDTRRQRRSPAWAQSAQLARLPSIRRQWERADRSLSRRSLGGARTNRPLAKSQGQQVIQAAGRRAAHSLKRALLAASGRPTDGRAACQAGPLALQLEDPIILRDEEPADRADGEPASAERPEVEEPELVAAVELVEGAALNLNCSTLEALVGGGQADGGQADGERRWPLAPARRKSAGAQASRRADQPGAGVDFCADPLARRRALISGKFQAQQSAVGGGEEAVARSSQRTGPTARSRNQQRAQHQIAYVKLEAGALELAGGARPATLADSAARRARVTKSLAQLDGQQQQQQQQWQRQLRAPPLLEWFINNQEAPKSSANYSPELPLLAPATSWSRERGLGAAPEQLAPQPPLLPSIDYAEYFANFDQRPLEQQLELNLRLDKRHFTSPDSQLVLRCTSTQAQVLMADAVSVSFLLAPANAAPSGQLQQQQLASSRAGQQQAQPLWQQRPVSPSGQAKQKYLHQYPRSSSQEFGGQSLRPGDQWMAPRSAAASTRQLAAGGGGSARAFAPLNSSHQLLALISQAIAICLLVRSSRGIALEIVRA